MSTPEKKGPPATAKKLAKPRPSRHSARSASVDGFSPDSRVRQQAGNAKRVNFRARFFDKKQAATFPQRVAALMQPSRAARILIETRPAGYLPFVVWKTTESKPPQPLTSQWRAVPATNTLPDGNASTADNSSNPPTGDGIGLIVHFFPSQCSTRFPKVP